MINPQWLELPMSRTNFHGPKDVRAIEVRLYFILILQIHEAVPELRVRFRANKTGLCSEANVLAWIPVPNDERQQEQ